MAVARKGKAGMGITGGYAGEMFALLIGFGSSMLKKIITTG